MSVSTCPRPARRHRRGPSGCRRSGSLLTAVETNTRSPQTIGLDTATPGTGVFHSTFSPVAVFHFTAVGLPSATPAAFAPRNDGHCCADNDAVARTATAMTG